MEESIFADDRYPFLMVEHLKHNDIDREKWDRCVGAAAAETIYPYSWYLDLVSPGWEGLVQGDYESVMPLTQKRKLGFRLLLQPILAQQLGVFSAGEDPVAQLPAFLSAVRQKYSYVDICLNRSNYPLPDGYACEIRTNHELDLGRDPAYNENTKRNLAKGKQYGHEFRKIGLMEYLDLKFSLEKSPATDRSYLENLFGGLLDRGSAETFGIFSGNEIRAGAVLARSGSRAIYLNGCSSDAGKESRAMFLLMDRLIDSCRGKYKVFDFEGSNLEGVGRFFEGFGAGKTGYPRLRIRKFPFI